MKKSVLNVAIICSVLGATGCAQIQGPLRPKFYPNETYRRYGAAAADNAYASCAALADEYGDSPSQWQEALKSGAIGAGVGAGTGAVGGVVMKGKVGRSTAAGAAIGGIAGVLYSLSQSGESNPSRQRFIEACLKERGYDVVDWRR